MKTRQPIAQRLQAPSRQEIITARQNAGLTQQEAGELVSSAISSARRTWQNYEADPDSTSHREIPLGLWELFLLLTDQHSSLKISLKK